MTRESAQGGNDSPAKAHALRVLRHRNFRLLWLGQLVATTGQQMQVVTLAVHVFDLTDSTFQVGLLAFFGILPFLFFSLIGGAVADRMERRQVILFSSVATMVPSSLLVVSTSAGFDTTVIFALAIVLGATRAFDAPARQALIPNIVPREELTSAFTLNTMLRQMAVIAGPALGGLLIGIAGVAAAYAVSTATVLAVMVAVLLMRALPPVVQTTTRGWELALGGFRFVRREPVVSSVLALDFLVTALGSTRALFPAFAEDVLEKGPEVVGALYAAPGAGAVVGAVILGSVGTGWRHLGIVLSVSACFGLCIIGFGLSTTLPLALFMLFGAGLVDVIGEIMRATIIQLRTPDEVRGRVTALNFMFAAGGPQFGQLQSGAIASFAGPGGAAIVGGFAVLLTTSAFALNPRMRRSATMAEKGMPVRTGASEPV